MARIFEGHTMHQPKHDFGKKNNGRTTGFSVVAKKAAAEYGSAEAGKRVAGAIFARMRAAGKA